MQGIRQIWKHLDNGLRKLHVSYLDSGKEICDRLQTFLYNFQCIYYRVITILIADMEIMDLAIIFEGSPFTESDGPLPSHARERSLHLPTFLIGGIDSITYFGKDVFD